MNLHMYPFNQIFAKNTADVQLLSRHINIPLVLGWHIQTFLLMHKLLVGV